MRGKMGNKKEFFRDELVSRLTKIQDLLQELEDFIKANGYKLPKDNIKLPIKEDDKIEFPKGYIRRKKDFVSDYRLNELIYDRKLRDNIAYSLQATDVFNYFLNRFNIKLSAGTVFKKISIILTFSIIEAILVGSYEGLRKYCHGCPFSNKCEYYLFSPKNKKFKNSGLRGLLKALENKNIIKAEKSKEILELKKIRDKIHIYTAEFNEYLKNEVYSIKTYNNSIQLLQYFKEEYPILIERFKRRRREACLKRNKI